MLNTNIIDTLKYAMVNECDKIVCMDENDTLTEIKIKDVIALIYHLQEEIIYAKEEGYIEFAYGLKQIPNVVVSKREIDTLLKEKITKLEIKNDD